jgi:hypothetical protein
MNWVGGTVVGRRNDEFGSNGFIAESTVQQLGFSTRACENGTAYRIAFYRRCVTHRHRCRTDEVCYRRWPGSKKCVNT